LVSIQDLKGSDDAIGCDVEIEGRSRRKRRFLTSHVDVCVGLTPRWLHPKTLTQRQGEVGRNADSLRIADADVAVRNQDRDRVVHIAEMKARFLSDRAYGRETPGTVSRPIASSAGTSRHLVIPRTPGATFTTPPEARADPNESEKRCGDRTARVVAVHSAV
jgi:hypothetical protein